MEGPPSGGQPIDASAPSVDASACSPADGAVACGAPSACGEAVTLQPTPAAPPAAEGGTLQDGSYELVQLVAFNAVSLESQLRATKVFSQGSLASTVGDVSNGQTIMSSGPYTVSGTTLTWTQTCPSAETLTYSFTARSGSLTLYQVSGSSTIAQLYVLQP